MEKKDKTDGSWNESAERERDHSGRPRPQRENRRLTAGDSAMGGEGHMATSSNDSLSDETQRPASGVKGTKGLVLLVPVVIVVETSRRKCLPPKETNRSGLIIKRQRCCPASGDGRGLEPCLVTTPAELTWGSAVGSGERREFCSNSFSWKSRVSQQHHCGEGKRNTSLAIVSKRVTPH